MYKFYRNECLKINKQTGMINQGFFLKEEID